MAGRAMGGFLQLVFHGHLPYVLSHGRWPHGADWVFEAAAETYIPLLRILRRAREEGIPIRFTMGISPVLAEQLAHPSFGDGFDDYLDMKVSAAREDQRYFSQIGDEARLELARMWEDYYRGVADDFAALGGDIVAAFRRAQEDGQLELITCAATHGYLPLLGTDNSVYAQLALAKRVHRRHFGVDPKGIWLPEAAYRPRYEWEPPVGEKKRKLRRGIEEFLYHLDIRYFFVDSHLLRGGRAIGVYIDRFEALRRLWAQFEREYKPRKELPRSPYKPYLCSSADGLFATPFFVRDPRTGLQVWSGEWGYPGNPAYLDFHKKHFPGGHRYWRVTNPKADLADKDIYRPEWVAPAIAEQADHFVGLCAEIVEGAEAEVGDVPPVITAPFDAELFGHWWFEGPRWLFEVAKRIAQNPKLSMTSGWEYLERYPPGDVVHLPEGSWGQGGFHYIWLNDWTLWTWEHIYAAEERMRRLANRFVRFGADGRLRRALAQAARELLLLEASDWQFLISTWSARDYAEGRVAFHWERFCDMADLAEKLFEGVDPPQGRWRELEILENQDDLFPDVDPSLWADEMLDF